MVKKDSGPNVARTSRLVGTSRQERGAFPEASPSSNAAAPSLPHSSSLPTPDPARHLEDECRRIPRQEQKDAVRYQRAWHHEQHLRLLRERQVRRLLQTFAPNGVPEAIRFVEERIQRSEEKYREESARENSSSVGPPVLGRMAPDASAGTSDDSVSAPVQELQASLIHLLQTEVAALGYDPQDPLFEEWLPEDALDCVRTAVRALGSLAAREAQRLADEVRRRTIEEESWNAIKPVRNVDPNEENRIAWRLYRSLGF